MPMPESPEGEHEGAFTGITIDATTIAELETAAEQDRVIKIVDLSQVRGKMIWCRLSGEFVSHLFGQDQPQLDKPGRSAFRCASVAA